ncbi:TonB-dependent receptor [Sandarakinorhabdus sp.]|uniref:TonB-dependent receptor n=1 Tax=Sandarakinorhabdus sp. TaxID=1916663 RepID=UPI00286D8D5F|nr:TonB-dependent receptor [Sandarakinorhabdus sp.]
MAIIKAVSRLLGCCALLTTAVQAQEAPVDPAEGEIIVTATRRAESLQDVPASITAFNSQAIQSAGIERPADFIGLTSNVNLVETQNAGNAFIIIRGITQARNSEPSVAVIVDGVQQTNPAQFNQELVDIEQIEVLKGPQGGLYGRNAIGGAIIIKSKAPTNEMSGKITAGVDNGFGYYLRGNLSGPLAENLKFRVSGSWYDTNGFIPNTFLGEDADPVKDLNLRGNLLFTPTPELTIDLRASVGLLRTQALYFNIVNDVNDTSLPVRVNNAGQNDRDLYNVALRVSYAGDAGTVTSITSYDKVSEILTGDAFNFLPIPDSLFFQFFGFDLNQSQFLDVDIWSQEVRYESPADKPLQVIVGGYAVGTKRYISTGNMIDNGRGVFPVYRTPSTNPLNPQFSFLADSQDNFAWALFGNAVWKVNEQLRVDASLRYDRDRRENTTLTPTGFLPNVAGFPQGRTGEVRKKTFSEWQPKLTLTWQPTDDITLFGGYSKGFRSGGFNQTGVGAVAAANGIVGVGDLFDAEVAETFEIGIKTQTSDRALTFNASAFTTKSENSYFFVFLAANSTQNLGNVPETRIKGFELDATWRAAPGLDLIAGFGYTDSEIRRFSNAAVIGNQAPLISRYTLNLTANYKAPITDTLDLTARVDYRRTGRTWFDVENSTSRDPVDIVDARIGVAGDAWNVTAFASNLFDERYNAEFSPGGFVFKARPRRYGIEASFSF